MNLFKQTPQKHLLFVATDFHINECELIRAVIMMNETRIDVVTGVSGDLNPQKHFLSKKKKLIQLKRSQCV